MNLLDWIKSLWTRRVRIAVYEVPSDLVDMPEKVSADVMLGLSQHPGFRHLLWKLKVMGSQLERELRQGVPQDLPEVERLKAHIKAVRWLEKEMFAAVMKPVVPKMQDPDAEMKRVLAHAKEIIEEVGKKA